jgi:5-formyltetrahydrofolate cyclo-ligase
VIAPLVGFDGEKFRLGYGGGFFDRTLAGFIKKPLVIGVGYAMQRIDTIHPQPHDIAMDGIVTETP